MPLFSRIFHNPSAPHPTVSVCIPVYNTEPVLERCLTSVAVQDLSEKEIVIVVDASPGTDEKGRTAREICKDILRDPETGKRLNYTVREHNKNLGILETRRDLVLSAHGDYIFMLDSDDFLEGTDCLTSMYALAKEHDADIVNSTATVFSDEVTAENKAMQIERMQKKLDVCQSGLLEGSDIIEGFLVQKNHLGYLWGKLIRRDLFISVLDQIPFTLCTMAEDFLFYFFISLSASRYWGTDRRWYRYGIDIGVSSHKKIDTMDQWIRVCSAASVFTIISQYLEGPHPPISPEVIINTKGICNFFVRNNLEQLAQQVIPELQDEAYRTLCDFWGEDYVRAIQQLMAAEHHSS